VATGRWHHIGLLLAFFPVFSAPAAQAPEAVFRATTKLIQVNVVAHDKIRRTVADLKQGDFEVFDNGQRQTLSVFVAETTAPQPRPTTPPSFVTNQFTLTAGARSGYARAVALDLRDETRARILRDGFGFQVTLPVPPAAVTLRVVVRDGATGRLGSLTVPLS
jgi:hypothetical protein